jgi:hypothetical protein
LHLQLLEVLRSRPSSVNQEERTAMASRKRVAATVRIQLAAGQASPGRVGQSLGAYGVNIVAFHDRLQPRQRPAQLLTGLRAGTATSNAEIKPPSSA